MPETGPSSDGPILVTGASGNVGAPLVAALHLDDRPVVSTTTAASSASSNGSVRRLDLEDPRTFAPALDGIDKVFLMRPPQISDTKRYIRAFIEAMVKARVNHVVFLSLMGVNRAMPHWQVEQDLRASPLAWTHPRPHPAGIGSGPHQLRRHP
jgi:uncharacterized protein YbjT (DUF2867 family)